MPRRDFITPPSLPADTQERCLIIPASQEWLGLVNAALLMLTEEWRYEQLYETSMTPAATAAAAYEMYVRYLEGECGMACCPLRYNPYTGRIQQSNDGGLSWFDVADGPWTESLYPQFSAAPPPRTEPTDEDKLCAAAATAAYVMRNLYTQTGNTLLNYVAATDWEYAGALGSMLTGFLMTIGAAATQPYVAIATLLGIVGVRQQYVDYPLDNDDEEQLKCIFLEWASVEPDGSVTFNFNEVWGAIDLASPKNGLVRFLMTMIGPDAFNFSGSIDAGLTPDCSGCGEPAEFCYQWDLTTGAAADWTIDRGTYIAGTGIRGIVETDGTGRTALIDIPVPAGVTITRVELTGRFWSSSTPGSLRWGTGRFSQGTYVQRGNAGGLYNGIVTRTFTGSWDAGAAGGISMYIGNGNSGSAGVNVDLRHVLVRGLATSNPFGTDNC